MSFPFNLVLFCIFPSYGSVYYGIGAHAPKKAKTNARQQEHAYHQTENIRLEVNIRVSVDVCVIVCENARTVILETTALTTFAYKKCSNSSKSIRLRRGQVVILERKPEDNYTNSTYST